MGLQHVVQPNAFALQLPHEQAHSPGEAALPNFEAVSEKAHHCCRPAVAVLE